MPDKRKLSSDLQGLTRLITDATIGITDIVEAMHNRVVHPPFLPSTPIQHLITDIAGITYKNIRLGAKLVGGGVDIGLGKLATLFKEIESTHDQESMRSVVNGVLGDYLEKTNNPLQITMQFRKEGMAITNDSNEIKKSYPSINGKILVMVHGSCMNDLQWTQNDHNHGLELAKEFGQTPVYLNYNSGRHISTNGQDFSKLLEELVLNWPVPVEELIIIAHSMGGLVSRSAVHYGQEQNKTWSKYLKKTIFLGTPHHGAPLEQVGNYVDIVLEAIPYAKPFARLGKIRSAGVTDLRYGNLIDEDWKGKDRFQKSGDRRLHIGLPTEVDCYSIAGNIGKETGSVRSQWVGDKMVTVKSALGEHKDPSRHLNFKVENTWIAHETSHLELLSDSAVYSTIVKWLGNEA